MIQAFISYDIGESPYINGQSQKKNVKFEYFGDGHSFSQSINIWCVLQVQI